MANDNREAGLVPVMTSLVGALAVVALYWIHLLALGMPLNTESGISITIFIAAFLAQYIPLKMVDNRYDLEKKM